MAITQDICNSFKLEILQGIHVFTGAGDQMKLALYPTAATLNKATQVYSSSGETTGTGYTAGGQNLSKAAPIQDVDSACISFSNISWTTATITAGGCLIYNADKANRAVSVHSFSGDKSATAGTFSLTFPAQTATLAIIRVG